MSYTKQASLDQTLGMLYREYGPALQKHAAARFYSTLDKTRLDQAALGAPFCKLAAASQMDPWKMAVQVVRSYPNLVKTASGQPSQVQELARFYVDWGDGMLKKAALPGAGLVGRAVKAVRGAVTGAPKPAVPKPTPAWTGGPRPTAPAAAPTTFREPLTPQVTPKASPASVPRPSPTVEVSQSLKQPPGREVRQQPASRQTEMRRAAQKREAWEAQQSAQKGLMSTPTGQTLAGVGTLAGLGGLGYMTLGGEGQPQY